MQKSFNGIWVIPFFILSTLLNAQVTTVSPYSLYGIGDFYPQTFTQNLGFGGASLGLRTPLNINPSNPASYSSLKLTSFEVGFEASRIELKQTNPSVLQKNSNAGLRYFSVGVPLTKWWGSAIGLQPYSFMGYDVSSHSFFEDTIGVTNSFVGTGGINQFFWGNAFQVAKGLSIGVNTNFMFGKLDETNYIIWDESNFVNSKYQTVASVRGIKFDYGLQYHYTLNNNKELGIGITYTNSTELNVDLGQYGYTFSGNIDSQSPIDSTNNSQESNAKTTLPSGFGIGLSYGKMDEQLQKHAWMISADFEMTKGSEFINYNGKSDLSDAYKIQAGMYVVPRATFKKLERNSSYWSLIEYRLGAYYENTPINARTNVGATQLNDYGITFGLGLPVRQRDMAPGEVRMSTVNTGFIIGQRGTLDNNLIQESYFKIFLGITLNDKWFIKYKYR